MNEGAVVSKITYATGIVYETKAGSLLENCVNKGSVTSTTTSAMGIVANVAGGMKGCVNEGSLMAKSTIAGVAYKVESTG